MVITDNCILSDEVREGKLFGIIYTYKADDVTQPESSAEHILSITYPTEPLKLALVAAFEKIGGKREQGVFIFSGGLGTGKSHALLAIYHIFNSPNIGKRWLQQWKVKAVLPKDTRVVLSHVLDEGPRFLWEPIFTKLGAADLLNEVEDYPKRPLIERLIGKKPLVIVLDEIEAWYDGIGDEVRQARNRNFLQILTEMATSSGFPLLLIISTSPLARSPDIRSLLDRVKPFRQDLSIVQEKGEIVLFRLFKEVSKKEGRETVTSYVKAYKKAEEQLKSATGAVDEYRKRMLAYYPLHPELIDAAFEGYGSARNYQNTRGVLYLFSAVLRKRADNRDLLLLSDVDPQDPEVSSQLQQLTPFLLEKCITDIERTEGIELSKEVLTTVLMHSLTQDPKHGADEAAIVLGTIRPGININSIYECLARVEETAWHLWRTNGRYLVKPEPVPLRVVSDRAQRKLSEEGSDEAITRLGKILRDMVGGTNVYVWPLDQVPDDRTLKIVVSMRHLSEEELDEFYFDREWRNSVLIVTPKGGDVAENRDLLLKAMRLVVSDEMRDEVEESIKPLFEELQKKEDGDLKRTLLQRYGWWQKAVGRGEEIKFRPIDCELKGDAIRSVVEREFDLDSVRQAILQHVEESKEEGISVSALRTDFMKFLGWPIILEKKEFDDSVLSLCQTGDIIAERGRSIYDSERPMSIVHDDAILRLAKFDPRKRMPAVEVEEGARVAEGQVTITYAEAEEEIVEVVGAPLRLLVTEEHATPFSLQSEVEGKLRSTDKISSVTITASGESLEEVANLAGLVQKIREAGAKDLQFRIKWKFPSMGSKEQVLKALEELPIPIRGSIKAELEVQRIEPED